MRCSVSILGALTLVGCALSPSQPDTPPREALAHCEAYLSALDETVAAHRVGDAGAWRLPGYRHLRSTRFLASFREQPMTPSQLRDWLEQLRLADQAARLIELGNLPAGPYRALLADAPASTHAQALAECGVRLTARDARDPVRVQSIRTRAAVPDHYRDWRRVLGLYPLSHLFVLRGVYALHDARAASFREPEPQDAGADSVRRWVPAQMPPLEDAALARALVASARNPLAVPRPDDDLADALLQRHAPVWEFEQHSRDDLIGEVRWDPRRAAPVVDTARATEYRWLSHARFQGRSLLQLNYLVWLPARTPTHARDIYAGAFDGLTWRVTLAPDGTALAYESMHACGCYYLLFPGPRVAVRAPDDGAEPVLVARQLPDTAPGERLAIRVRARDHYVQQVYLTRDRTGEAYLVRPYADLLRLDDGAGGRRSLFDEDGLLPASARPERWLLWPTGVLSAGAMRRNGTHAIAFVGVRHFDDADLLQRQLQPHAPLW